AVARFVAFGRFLFGVFFLRPGAFLEQLLGRDLGLFGLGLLGEHVLAARDALGFVLGARDDQVDLHADLRVEDDADLALADVLDGLVERHLGAADREAALGDGLGDVARRNRAVELAAVARLAQQCEGLAFELPGNLLGFGLALQVAGLELRLLGLEVFAVGLVGAQGLLLGQEVVAGEAVLHLHL